jgi:uncharacterized protein YjbI with pentapeptide repeats
MKRTLTALTVAASLTASGASAFDPEDLQALNDNYICIRCDLSGANLKEAILIGVNLTGTNLSGADLSLTNMASVNLSGANLSRANLILAHMGWVNLSGANLRGADLLGADLRWANLLGADLSGSTIAQAILCNTTMPDGSVNYSNC